MAILGVNKRPGAVFRVVVIQHRRVEAGSRDVARVGPVERADNPPALCRRRRCEACGCRLDVAGSARVNVNVKIVAFTAAAVVGVSYLDGCGSSASSPDDGGMSDSLSSPDGSDLTEAGSSEAGATDAGAPVSTALTLRRRRTPSEPLHPPEA
jgi:hypothetical protein